jgi:Acetyltransferase (GNAT) domain
MTSIRTVAGSVEPQDFVRVIRSVEDISDIRDHWQACCLHRDTDVDRYLHDTITSEATRPHVLVHYNDGRPKALLIGRYEVQSPGLRLGYFRIQTRKVRFLTFLNGGLIGDVSAQTCSRFVDSILASLKAGEADAATIHYCELDSPFVAIARSRPGRLLSDRVQRAHVHRMRTIVDERTSSTIGLSTRERQHQRRREKLLQEFRGQVRIVCFRSDAELDRLVEDVELVAKKTYQRGLGVGFSDTPQIRNRLHFDARMGWLHAYVLYIEERPCAFWITTVYRSTLYSDFLGFDPAYGRYSPGVYLIVEVIDRLSRHSADPRVRLIDFGVGEAEYKIRLGNRSQQKVSVSIFAPSARGVTLNALQTFVRICQASAERLLMNSGLLARLKRAWRSRIRPR